MKFDDIHIAIVSHARPQNVKLMEESTGMPEEITWYVGTGEKKSYSHAKGTVIESGKLCPSRNRALEDAFEQKKHCLMLDDDYVKTKCFNVIGESEMTFTNLVMEMYTILLSSPLYLAGTASTINRYFYHPETPLGLKHFIGGWCTLTRYGATPRYDEELKTKEDYDITLQHIMKYGGVLRINYLAPQFKHYNNPGGVVEYRNEQVEQESIKRLKMKWGKIIRDNPKRPNEILLKI